ncbi:MAG: porin family protein [Saprospiraceae bacterium]|nr:porin family protein [Saprospiraceae bacterium]MCF8249310.1 porin family protein [Saprospiraceae bacterium]MCF8279731.1 porin family protein [Bacteroidales bacterium]MCF8311413.1 porin family protein [Saprospiraceae bacterium]MCF8439929.1 porin family protein [Saprospiraceae bacterium]
MKKQIILLIFSAIWAQAMAQYTEVGAFLGTSNYIGDLSNQRISNQEYHGVLGVFGRYNANKRFSVKASLLKGMISGKDTYARSIEMRERNLSFRSDLTELAVTGELNLSDYNIRANKGSVPYLFMGLAVTRFNPQAEMRGVWYDLQPLHTEGKKYSQNTLAVPLGLGMRFNVSYKLNFGLEFGARFTSTDYLDDVSSYYPDVFGMRSTSPMTAALSYRTPEVTGSFGENPMGKARGDAANNDWYFFAGITVSVNLTDKYGLDFDKKYDVFKEHLQKPKKEKLKRNNLESSKYKQKRTPFWKKNEMEPIVKKRTSKTLKN